MNAIEVENLTRRFGRLEAVRGISFSVAAGSVCALLGQNGAGKTTTLKLLMGLLPATSGTVRVLGADALSLGPRERARIGYVSENQKLPLWMTARQLLDYCRPFYPTWDTALEQALLAQMAVPVDRKLGRLSRGTLMKAALVASLSYRPELLILDEPFSGLDPLVRDEVVRGILEASASGGWTVIISSHDIEEVERMTDQVVLLESGKVKLDESTRSLQSRFRRVEADGVAQVPVTPPPSWLGIEHAGGRIAFVDASHDGETSPSRYAGILGGAPTAVRPMSLREIFITLARETRATSNGGAK